MVEEKSSEQTCSDKNLSKVEAKEQRVSLSQKVREGLQKNPKVFFAGAILHFPDDDQMWTEKVEIIIAPVKPIYDLEKLNQFMDSLVPNIPRSSRDEAFRYPKKPETQLGRLYFDETLGDIRRGISITTTAVEPEALKRAGIPLGKSHKTEEESIIRKTWVRVYPDANSAKVIAEYEQGFADGTVEFNETLDRMKFFFSVEQFKQRGKIVKKPLTSRPKPLGGL